VQGYDEGTSEEISQLYDFMDIYKEHKEGNMSYWTTEMIDKICE
jgi:hypothetical protein